MSKICPFIEPELKISDKVAIVGSSANLLDTEYGDLIDSFDDVIRFNRAIVKGFEKYCGSKTTIRVCNWHVFGNITSQNNEHQRAIVNFIKNEENCNILLMDKNVNNVFHDRNVHETSKKFSVIKNNSNHFRRNVINAKIVEDFGIDVLHPSIGLSSIYMCIMMGIKPTLFGFGIKEGSKTSHYWEKRPENPSHNLSKEREIILKLEEKGLIEVYV